MNKIPAILNQVQLINRFDSPILLILYKPEFMSIDKELIFQMSTEDKRMLAFELLDSIDEEFINITMPEWKKRLIRERVESDIDNPTEAITWKELKKKYYGQ